jgi:glyoxylase-like metal-dependent hydrolase (beta-lactamase superfamily II)
MQLIFEQIRTGGDRNFGYLLADRDARQAVLIDPSYAPEVLVARATEQQLQVKFIVNTHGHEDHTNGNDKAVELTGAPVVGHRGLPAKPDVALADGQELAVGALHLKFMEVPGHADDHLVVYEPTYDLLITGDLLFVGKIGGTRSEVDARTEWQSCHDEEALLRLKAEWPDFKKQHGLK